MKSELWERYIPKVGDHVKVVFLDGDQKKEYKDAVVKQVDYVNLTVDYFGVEYTIPVKKVLHISRPGFKKKFKHKR